MTHSYLHSLEEDLEELEDMEEPTEEDLNRLEESLKSQKSNTTAKCGGTTRKGCGKFFDLLTVEWTHEGFAICPHCGFLN